MLTANGQKWAMRVDLCSLPEPSWIRQLLVHAALIHCGYTAHRSISNFKTLSAWYMHSGVITHAFKSHEALIPLETTMGDQVLGNSLLSCMHRHA